MENFTNNNKYNGYYVFLFSFILSLITYGFALTNYSVTIDNETPIYSDFGMIFGRWGQNLIRYHIFGGHLQYFTLILSLFCFSLASLRLSKLFNFEGLNAYAFCCLFLTFPQVSYQIIFSMMADVSGIGVLISILCVELFLKAIEMETLLKKALCFLSIVLLLVFLFSIYQAFILFPVTILMMLFFINTFKDNFILSFELKKILSFFVVLVLSAFLYVLSVKLLCPPIPESGYLSSFVSGNSKNLISNFLTLWKTNLLGNAFYGEKLFMIVPILLMVLVLKIFKSRKYIIYRILSMLFLVLSPFFISFFITSGYNPPRLYLTSNLVFAFFCIFFIEYFKLVNFHITKIIVVLFAIINIYFITNLFNSVNKIYKHDRRIAEKIDDVINSKYPNFETTNKVVYFHGSLPYDYHQKFRLENSEIFGGSFYSWDNGSNFRLINFFNVADVAEYKMVEEDMKDKYFGIKDAITKMPSWPDRGSIKMINEIVVVKLGSIKGAPLFFE